MRAGAGTHRATLHPGNDEITVRGGETLLEAGLRAGVPLPSRLAMMRAGATP